MPRAGLLHGPDQPQNQRPTRATFCRRGLRAPRRHNGDTTAARNETTPSTRPDALKIAWTLLFLTSLLATGPAASEQDRRLFVNLTSDEPLRAGMAIGQALKARQRLKIPVTLLLSVEGVRLADTRVPSPVYPDGTPIREMLKRLLAAGGTVLVCPMCMRYVAAIPQGALLEGVRVAGPDTTFPALFAEGTRTLSY